MSRFKVLGYSLWILCLNLKIKNDSTHIAQINEQALSFAGEDNIT